MALSLSLLRHRLAQPRDNRGPAIQPPRPDGPLIWAHVGAGVHPDGASLVLDRLCRRQPDLSVLRTGGPDDAVDPPDTAGAARRWLDHWRPDCILWTGAGAAPNIWSEALCRGVPIVGAELSPETQPWPLVRAVRDFHAAFGLSPDPRFTNLVQARRLNHVDLPPVADPTVLQDMSATLSARPVWLALDVPQDEIGAICEAHRRAARLSHRLVLILRGRADAAAALDRSGLRWARHEDLEPGDRRLQVVLAEESGRDGVWMRLAPITYLGGTLNGPGPATSPWRPASLGSAIIHGPRHGRFADPLDTLARAGATVALYSAAQLGPAVERLISPDRAAEQAQAAWRVASEGAEASAALLDALEDALESVEAI